MKLWKFVAVVCPFVVSLAFVRAGDREFTEKDGGRTLQGRIESANDETVTLRLANNRTVTFKHEILTAGDVEYIREWAAKNRLSGNIALSATRENGERGSLTTGGIYEYRTEEVGFRVGVRNTSNSGAITGIPVKWHLVVTRADGKTEVVSGTETVATLNAGTGSAFSTDKVTLQTSCKSLSSCPTCVRTAKDFGGDRIEGVLVELLNDDAEVIRDLVTPSSRERRIREAVHPPTRDSAS